jgi:hypothetical protein
MLLFESLNGVKMLNIREFGDEMSKRNPKPFLKRLRLIEMSPNRYQTRFNASIRFIWQE